MRTSAAFHENSFPHQTFMLRAALIVILALSTLPAGAADQPKGQQQKKPEPPTQLFIASGTLVGADGAPIQVHSLKAPAPMARSSRAIPRRSPSPPVPRS
jgi:hypothetical protein